MIDRNAVGSVIGALLVALACIASFWRIIRSNPGNKVIESGSITLIVFVLMLVTNRVPGLPDLDHALAGDSTVGARVRNYWFSLSANVPCSKEEKVRMTGTKKTWAKRRPR